MASLGAGGSYLYVTPLEVKINTLCLLRFLLLTVPSSLCPFVLERDLYTAAIVQENIHYVRVMYFIDSALLRLYLFHIGLKSWSTKTALGRSLIPVPTRQYELLSTCRIVLGL